MLLDAISQATGVPDNFPGYPAGMRALQLPDPTLKSYFLTLFGRSERVTACACERSGEVTMPQLLHLQNGDDVVQKIRAGDGRLAGLLKKGDAQVTEELFLATLARLAVGEGEGSGNEGAGRRRSAGRGVPRSVLGAVELEGIYVQPLTTREEDRCAFSKRFPT